MKKIYLCFIATLIVFIATSANGQNRCVLKSDNGTERVITSSYQMRVFQQNDQEAIIHYSKGVKPQVKGVKATHILNVYPPTDYNWTSIMLSDGENLLAEMYYFEGDHLTVELEEGTYYVACDSPDYIWLRDDIEFNADMDIQVDFGECVNVLSLDLQDENGHPLDEVAFVTSDYYTYLLWLDGVLLFERPMINMTPNYYHNITWNFNSFDERSSIINMLWLEDGNQKTYYLWTPQQNGLDQSVTLTVNADELKVIQERFYINNSQWEASYYQLNDRFYDKNGGFIGDEGGWSRHQIFNPELPYTIVTNVKDADPTDTQTYFRRVQLRPRIYEGYYHDGSGPEYDDAIVTSFSLDVDGNLVREASTFYSWPIDPPSFPEFFPNTPASVVGPTDKMAYYGERTPIAVYHPNAFNANTSPLNATRFYGSFYYTGEHSCERLADYDANIQVQIDWQMAYNDHIYNFNDGNNSFTIDPGVVMVDAHNDHLIANGLPKINHTNVQFDLNKDDAIPPTMTFLRVLDENGDESIYLGDLSQSTIVFGCADFGYHYQETEWGGSYDHMTYNDKPEVTVKFSMDAINAGDWIPLEVTEDPSLFHENYGNVFVADLSQIADYDVEDWVTVQFRLTDAAGNRQVQNLSFLFYAGKETGVQEHNNLSHSVYPNPFANEVKIIANQAVNGTANIQVYNVLGEQVYSKTENCADTKELTIDGSALKPGIYFYRINTENGLLQGKIVKD